MDLTGAAAMMSVTQQMGISLHISVDYLSELPDGEECEVTATVTHSGKSTAAAAVDVRVKRTGRLAARGTHIFLVLPQKQPLKFQSNL